MSLPQHMSGVVLTGHGDLDKLAWRDDLPTPQPGPGDVVIRVAAAGVNNTDLNTRIGWYSKGDGDAEDASWGGTPLSFPRIQGADICGHIAAVGAGIDASRIGERVIIEPCLRVAHGKTLPTPWYIGSECDGGFAQYARVDARYAHKIDCDLTDIELASFPCSYSTAENMLHRAGLAGGETVLITGASGGVGSAAVQLARARGAQVIAITSPSKFETLTALGADRVLARDADLVASLGSSTVDMVVDLVAGPAWPALPEVLRPGGRYAVAGAIAGPLVTLDVRTLYLKDLSFFGCTVLDTPVFGNLVRRIEAGDIKPLVDQVFDLKDIAAAQTTFLEKGYIGKIVLQVP